MCLGKVSSHKLHLYLWISDCIIATVVLIIFFSIRRSNKKKKKEKRDVMICKVEAGFLGIKKKGCRYSLKGRREINLKRCEID